MTIDRSERTEHTVLIAYASANGSTAEIAEFIGERMRDKGLHVRVAPVSENPDPARFEAVVLGSAVHNGEFLPEFAEYTERHGLALRMRPAWLFSVGMGPALRGPLGAPLRHFIPPAIADIRKHLCALGYRSFAGVLPRPDDRRTRIIVRLLGCRFADLRDWPAVSAWADSLAIWIDARLPQAPFPAVREP
ncbi:flavodoxin domain-containing protein [Nocardia sp. BMG51109]|uniref:flavodoxin domain-containing protein n=1 Tax=Nocardia sp. BMG51109 TaxID=1056816 RepID=UPI000466A95D|nr:flavodoxin domain-containing protein [Nocardia sp. BMG51109]